MAGKRKGTSPPPELGVSPQPDIAGMPSRAGSREKRPGRAARSRTAVLGALKSAPVGLACVAFVAAASLALMLPKSGAAAGPELTVDSQNVVTSVVQDSNAWLEGIRPGWRLIATDSHGSYYGDELGSIRAVPTPAAANSIAVGDVLPAIAVLALAGVLALSRLRRTGATVAVVGAVMSAPVIAARLGGFGEVAALVPVAIGGGLTWRLGLELGVRPLSRHEIGPFLGRFALPFVVAPAAVFAAATLLGGLVAGVVFTTCVYLALAWILVLRWRVGVARAEVRAHAAAPGSLPRLAVARELLADLLPFSDRIRRRGAQAERNRLASDLHAELLPAIARTASELERRGATNEAEELRNLAAGVRDLVSERRLPILDEEGLVAAAEWLAESLEDRTSITVEIDLDRWDGCRQPVAVEHAAYRVLQLALDNIIRHAGASHAFVSIEGGARSLVLTIADDGVGMDDETATHAAKTGHLGISDMRAEADAVGTSLTIEPRSPRGTQVLMKWRA